jgi:hypothetical protein
MPNQHKPLRMFSITSPVLFCADNAQAPEDVIQGPLTFFFNLGLNDPQIAQQCRDHYDTDMYGLRSTF